MRVSEITFTTQPFDGGAHVCMTHKMPEHNTDSYECWCRPTISVLCSECEDEHPQNCWKCGGEGWIRIDAAGAEMSDLPCIIVHNESASP